jgi:hypothetical protein
MLTADSPFELNPVGLGKPAKTQSDQLEQLNATKYELADGEIIKFTVGRCYPSPIQEMLAEELCRLLNAKIAHDGRWRTVWVDPQRSTWCKVDRIFRPWSPTVLQCQYLDKDGDIWCCVNVDEDAYEVIDTGVTHYVEKCEEAYQWVYNLIHNVVEVKHGEQTKMLAKGERLTPTDWLPPQT